MVRYKPDGWSVQAREMADEMMKSVQLGYANKAEVLWFFRNSYRPQIIRFRAAKRFGRNYKKNI